MAESTRLGISQRSMDQVPLSERLMKRPVRSRMQGVVGEGWIVTSPYPIMRNASQKHATLLYPQRLPQ